MESEKCATCAEPCPMADMAHEAAKGRMYATKEFIGLLKKIESGQLVEVVRCKDCKHHVAGYCCRDINGRTNMFRMFDNDFCSYGERKNNE